MSGTGTHATSSTFRYVDPSQYKNIVSDFNYPNTNQSMLSAKARTQWIVRLLAHKNPWYWQFL